MAFVYYQIFCDESGKYHNPNDPLIAFAGLCANPDRLRPFDSEWRSLLLSYEIKSLHMKHISRLEEQHGYRFHAYQTIDQRTDLLLPFVDCINKHLEMGFLQAWDVRAYNTITLEAKKLLGGSSDPFYWAFVRGLTEIVDRIGEDDKISIICDDDEETAWNSYLHYREAGKARWEIPKKSVALTFANDTYFPALQAADLVAFLTKHEANEQFFKQPNIWSRLYSRLTTEPEPPYGTMRWWAAYNDKDRIAAVAADLQRRAEQKKLEKQNAKSGVQKIRHNDGRTVEGATQRVKKETGRGKRGKAKAEGR
jgi:hypothetical protein